MLLPGVGAGVLGTIAGFVRTAVTLPLTGMPVGTGITCGTFPKSFPRRLLEVGMAFSKEKVWMETLLDGLVFSEFPTGLGKMVAEEGYGVETPVGA